MKKSGTGKTGGGYECGNHVGQAIGYALSSKKKTLDPFSKTGGFSGQKIVACLGSMNTGIKSNSEGVAG